MLLLPVPMRMSTTALTHSRCQGMHPSDTWTGRNSIRLWTNHAGIITWGSSSSRKSLIHFLFISFMERKIIPWYEVALKHVSGLAAVQPFPIWCISNNPQCSVWAQLPALPGAALTAGPGAGSAVWFFLLRSQRHSSHDGSVLWIPILQRRKNKLSHKLSGWYHGVTHHVRHRHKFFGMLCVTEWNTQ